MRLSRAQVGFVGGVAFWGVVLGISVWASRPLRAEGRSPNDVERKNIERAMDLIKQMANEMEGKANELAGLAEKAGRAEEFKEQVELTREDAQSWRALVENIEALWKAGKITIDPSLEDKAHTEGETIRIRPGTAALGNEPWSLTGAIGEFALLKELAAVLVHEKIHVFQHREWSAFKQWLLHRKLIADIVGETPHEWLPHDVEIDFLLSIYYWLERTHPKGQDGKQKDVKEEIRSALEELDKTGEGGREARKKWESLLEELGIQLALAPPGRSSVATVETGWSLHTATFETPHGKIRVHLPDDLTPGDTISGTVMAEPVGESEQERQKNQDDLNGYVVGFGRGQARAGQKWGRWVIPLMVAGALPVILRDQRGNLVGRTEGVSLQPQPSGGGASGQPGPPAAGSLPGECQLPKAGQTGRPVEIPGPFDGDIRTTSIQVGEQEVAVLAESPRKTVAQNPGQAVGPAKIRVKDPKIEVEGDYRCISGSLVVPKTALLKGERTRLRLTLTGLADLQETVSLRLVNLTPGVVRIEGGDAQVITIRPKEVRPDGTCTVSRSLTGIQPGAFRIQVQVQNSARPGDQNSGRQ